MLEQIRGLYDYTAWANRRTLDACAALPEEQLRRDLGSSFPSVLATLSHLAGADWIWLRRWHGESPAGPPPGWDPDSLGDLRERWEEVQRERARFVGSLTDEELGRVVHYRNLKGTAWSDPLWQLLMHVANHSTYHRGQVATMLRQLGAGPPSTDLVAYLREDR